MAPIKRKKGQTAGRPTMWVNPQSAVIAYGIQVFGQGFGTCPVAFLLDGKRPIRPARVLKGGLYADRVKPDQDEFHVVLSIPDLEPGAHELLAVVTPDGKESFAASARFALEARPLLEKDGRPADRWFRRWEHFYKVRFPGGIDRTPGSRLRALEHRDRMRIEWKRRKFDQGSPDDTKPPIDPGINWYCIGPSVVRNGQVFSTVPSTYTITPISGRISAIAYDPNDPNVIYAGAAQGGVWKSTDGGLNWRPKSDDEISLAVGSVTVDPSVTDGNGRSTRIFIGTGEPNSSDSYYGAGMLFSADGGETWAARGTATFVRAAFSRIAVDPSDNQHLYAATDAGVYESNNEGVNWTQIETGICHDLVVDWANAGGPEIYVGKKGVGVRRSQDGGVNWTTLGGGLPGSVSGRVALAIAPSDSATLYAAISNGSGLTGIYKTSDGGTNWTTVTSPASGSQCDYNLVLAVHPTAPNTLLFGEVHLWLSTTGGTAWTRVSTGSPGIHADQHAIAFHPTDGTKVFVGNDGGCWYSTDGGVTYTHRNKDLATLQYFTCANHATWEGILLGGTQDNGAQRYIGHPAWEHSALGDGAYAAINATSNPHLWFESRWYSFPCFRNDDSGNRLSPWNQKQTGIATNSNWFYPPFEMDPNDSTVLYCGYDKLFRTSNSGDSWTAITGTLQAGFNITAIAVAPSDSNTVYVGLQNGRVFQLTFSSGAWTASNITSMPLPAGQISDVAVHPTSSSTVYVTTSNLIFSEGANETFNTDHVYRTTNASTWSSVSSGLSQSNPVNAIALDPANPDTVYIGCDVGVFRSTTGGSAWAPFDDGLPNCSVQDLKFFAPLRLLRAATHGRSIWERPVDAGSAPLTDLYLRDDFVDTGRRFPSPSGVTHPFNPSDTVYWWQSVDIKVDSPDPSSNTYQTASTDIDYIQFEDMQHDNPRRGTWVRLYVQVHNRGNRPANNVDVRAFWANASGGLPPLPSDFWTVFPTTDPSDTTVWHPVGPAYPIDILYPGQPRIAHWSWLVPADAPNHSCMLAAARCDEDLVTTTSLDIGMAVTSDNNVTLKNLHIDDVVPGATGADSPMTPMFIDFHGDGKTPFDIRLNEALLPRGTRIYMFFPALKTEGSLEQALRGVELRPVDNVRIPRRPEESCQLPTKWETAKAVVLEVGKVRNDKECPGLYRVIPQGTRFSAAIFVQLPKDVSAGERFTFHVEHWARNRLVGGSTYELRVHHEKELVPDPGSERRVTAKETPKTGKRRPRKRTK